MLGHDCIKKFSLTKLYLKTSVTTQVNYIILCYVHVLVKRRFNTIILVVDFM